jgi:hypothetical protein
VIRRGFFQPVAQKGPHPELSSHRAAMARSLERFSKKPTINSLAISWPAQSAHFFSKTNGGQTLFTRS